MKPKGINDRSRVEAGELPLFVVLLVFCVSHAPKKCIGRSKVVHERIDTHPKTRWIVRAPSD